jgi:hypothetical protein
MPPTDETTVVCPNCRSPLTVAVSDLGHLVECPGCDTQFRARRPAAEPSRDDVRPPRRQTERERVYEQQDEVDDRPRRERRPGILTAVAVMDFVYAGLTLACSLLGTVIWLVFRDDLRQPGDPKPNLALDVVSLLAHLACGVVLLFAGTLVLQRKGWGLSVGALLLAAFCLVLDILDIALHVQGQAGPIDPDETASMVCGVVFLVVFWLGYLVTNGILLAKAGRHFR